VTELLASPDIVVVGAGASGMTAALAAARSGADVVLVDRLPFLGGTSTAVLDTFYGFYTPGERTRKVVDGLPSDVVTGLEAIGPVVRRPNTYGAGTGVTYHAEHLKVVWERMARAAGVRVLMHTSVQGVEHRDSRVTALTVGTVSGLATIRPRLVIDASGDASLCYLAGFGFEQAGDESPSQTLTTTFRMINVDMERRKEVTKAQFFALMEQGARDGYGLPRKTGSDHITPVDGMTATVMTRLDAVVERDGQLVNTSDPWFRSEAEMAGREQALEYARFLIDRVPGYEKAALGAFSTQIGVRESRRVYGDYRVTRDDVLGAQQFDDQVALCGAPIEDHHSGEGTAWHYIPDSGVVGIPARSLIVRDASNVLVAGRCFSATHDAHASIRSMAQCMAMGQAVGTWAGLTLQKSSDLRSVQASELREKLRADGAIVDDPADTAS
jgi:hypothetical protein